MDCRVDLVHNTSQAADAHVYGPLVLVNSAPFILLCRTNSCSFTLEGLPLTMGNARSPLRPGIEVSDKGTSSFWLFLVSSPGSDCCYIWKPFCAIFRLLAFSSPMSCTRDMTIQVSYYAELGRHSKDLLSHCALHVQGRQVTGPNTRSRKGYAHLGVPQLSAAEAAHCSWPRWIGTACYPCSWLSDNRRSPCPEGMHLPAWCPPLTPCWCAFGGQPQILASCCGCGCPSCLPGLIQLAVC